MPVPAPTFLPRARHGLRVAGAALERRSLGAAWLRRILRRLAGHLVVATWASKFPNFTVPGECVVVCCCFFRSFLARGFLASVSFVCACLVFKEVLFMFSRGLQIAQFVGYHTKGCEAKSEIPKHFFGQVILPQRFHGGHMMMVVYALGTMLVEDLGTGISRQTYVIWDVIGPFRKGRPCLTCPKPTLLPGSAFSSLGRSYLTSIQVVALTLVGMNAHLRGILEVFWRHAKKKSWPQAKKASICPAWLRMNRDTWLGRNGHTGTKSTILRQTSILGVDSPFFSAIAIFKNQPLQGCWWFSRKKDPWKEWEVTPRSTPFAPVLQSTSNRIRFETRTRSSRAGSKGQGWRSLSQTSASMRRALARSRVCSVSCLQFWELKGGKTWRCNACIGLSCFGGYPLF